MINKIAEELKRDSKKRMQHNQNNNHRRKHNHHNNKYDGYSNKSKSYKKDDTFTEGNITFAKPNEGYSPKEVKKNKEGWDRPEVQFAAGAGTIGLGTMMAMSGNLGPGKTYFEQSKNQAFKGMNRYLKKNVKPLHRTFIDIATKSFKDIKNSENKRMTPSQQVDKMFKETYERKSNLNNKYIKDEAARSMSEANTHNAFEKIIAKQENRKPNLYETDPLYHLEKAKNEYIANGERNKSVPNKSRMDEYKGIVGSSILGGSGFALGVSGIHALDRSLNSKKTEEEARKEHEETFRAAGSLLFDDRKGNKK